ncbi:putative cyclin-B3-1 [Malus sylvestris]|uniref:putative cyclin-B3-1 n=1 Tax=Malus sylvestris TaxID=3752 RepID=UPI0021ABFB8D|nr:putative cyclin-B3-1 [Malus sylvestris]
MEKQKGIPGSSAANANVGRSALADVSNVKSNSSRIFGGDASKRKLGKGRESPSQAISKLQTSKRGNFNTSEVLENAVKAKVGKKVVPRVNDTTKSHLLRNQPTLSTLKACESQRSLKSKGASGPNKLVSATATSSKTEKVVTSSLPENIKHEKHEATQGELPSESNCSQNLKAEELPSIDDDCNQLEVSDYVDEIYQYYWVSEAQNPPPENFMSIQADITPHMRVTIKKDDKQLVGHTALLLASKYEDFLHPRVKDLISISAETYTRVQVLGMLEHLAFYLIELCLVEYEALRLKPSLLCAAALYVARCTLQITLAWTPLLCKHARYDVSQIRDCAEMVLRFHKAARMGSLKVTYEKVL